MDEHQSNFISPIFDAVEAPRAIALPNEKNAVSQRNETEINPVSALMALCDRGVEINELLLAMNKTFAVAKYGNKIVITSIIDNGLIVMNDDDFHKMFANLVTFEEFKDKNGATKRNAIKVSKRWFEWPDRCQYLGRGVVFEPGSPLEIPNDMLNLWRGFGIEPKQGNWTLMRKHIYDVICSGQKNHFDYLIKWMAYAVQHLNKPIGVAVALLGAQGAGKGVVARAFGKFFGQHFAHITHGDQLTGRFNANLGTSCAVFLDEALWAGDKKREGVLKGLITEPRLQLEAKFRDPIMVTNRLRIIAASNDDWAVPAGTGDRRWFVLNVANTYAGTVHRKYWDALYAEIETGGAAAMLHKLLAIDLSGFDVRAVPHTAAKAQQQERSLQGTMAWLCHVLQDGTIRYKRWSEAGLTVSTDDAYECYKEFSKQQHDWRPEIKDLWSKKLHAVLAQNLEDTRPTDGYERVRSFQFAPLADCRRKFATHLNAPDLEWQPTEWDTLQDAASIEWEPELEPDYDNWPEYEPEDERE